MPAGGCREDRALFLNQTEESARAQHCSAIVPRGPHMAWQPAPLPGRADPTPPHSPQQALHTAPRAELLPAWERGSTLPRNTRSTRSTVPQYLPEGGWLNSFWSAFKSTPPILSTCESGQRGCSEMFGTGIVLGMGIVSCYPQGRCGRHLLPERNAAGAGSGTLSGFWPWALARSTIRWT